VGQVGGTLTNAPVAVSNGRFAVTLDFGAAAFPGGDRWLEIAVRPGTNTGAYTTLSPRQLITSTPYAVRAAYLTGTLPLSQLPGGVVTNNPTAVTLSGTFSGNGANVTNVNAAQLGGRTAGQFWQTGGNSGTTPGADFPGTTDNQPVLIRANNQRALRLEPTADGANLIGGHPNNVVFNGVVGAVIAGGGASNLANEVSANHAVAVGGLGNSAHGQQAFIGGGRGNRATGAGAVVGGGGYTGVFPDDGNEASGPASTIAGGDGNRAIGINSSVGGGTKNIASSLAATVAGGAGNTASNVWSFVGGGDRNTAGGERSAVMGGLFNLASGAASVVAGGSRNTASNLFASVPGGGLNVAGGQYSFAAGRRAKALHDGSFVWADSQGTDFNSTAPNQFAVRAAGGMFLDGRLGIGLTSPSVQLEVEGDQAVGRFTTTNNAFGAVLILKNSLASPAYLGAINFDSEADTPGQIGYLADDQMAFRVGGEERMTLDASGLTVAGVIAGNGSGLSQLNAANLATGTLAEGRLSANVALRAGGNTFSGNQIISGGYLKVNGPSGEQAYLGGDGAGGDVEVGSLNPAVGAVGLWNASTGQYMDLFARSATLRGWLSFGAATRQMINLYNTNYAIGVQTDAASLRTGGEFLWYRGGSHSDTFGDAGAGGTQLMRLGSSGNLVIAGTLSQGSDRNIKQDFAAVDVQAVLAKVAALPILSWNYTNQSGVKHYGPMAQDFHAAFGLNGAEDKHIATVDADGVARTAIQGLNEKVEGGRQKAETSIRKLEAENAELKARLERLEQLLSAKSGGGQ